ncbi:MAG: transposase [Crocinitomicaceae bacterium]|nr:transposase [Crocinitomicaceae bacterium]
MTSRRKRRNFNPEFKVKVVLEALKERESIQQLAQKYEIHPNQITAWKQEFVKNAACIFSSDQKDTAMSDKDHENLLARIGQLLVENDFLKKSLS